jgi:hypothetical protein
MRNKSWLLLLLAVGAGCASHKAETKAPTPAAPDPGLSWRGDTTLARVLAVMTMGARELTLSDTLASVDGEFDYKLARILSEGSAPPLIRTNAILLLGDRGAPGIVPYLDALGDPDERVRAAAVVAMKNQVGETRELEDLIRGALEDSSKLVQAKALEALADLDITTLRTYLARTTDPTLRNIATDLVSAAENRGAGLTATDSTGRLAHTGPAGRTIIYRPKSRWPGWDASAGDLFVTGAKKDTAKISANVEVVSGVVPAFFSIDGRYLVYEAAREVHVRDLQSGSDRLIGAGIAPRLMPFSESFVYLRQKEKPMSNVAQTSFKYEVVRGWFAEPKESVLGDVTVVASYDKKGYYSPARWMRIRESDGAFFLSVATMEPFKLPDPFTGK